MADSLSKSTHNSWGSRIVSSITGVIVGVIMIPASMFLLSWNEANSLDTAKSIQEGAAAVIDIAPDPADPANNAKLVHLTGEATTKDEVSDPTFEVSAVALRLSRDVEMYQWVESESSEEKKNLGGSTDTVTTYKYEKKWSDALVDSSRFHESKGHENPTALLAKSQTFTAGTITLGAFTLPDSIVHKMDGDESIKPTQEDFDALAANLKDNGHLIADGYYFGKDPAAAAIGDTRVTFTVLKPGTFSIIAQQNGGTFQPYPARAGKEIELVESGTASAALMFKHAQDQNRIFTWLLRLAGFVVMLIGFALILKPLSVIADVIPFVGSLVGAGTFLTSLLLAAVGTLATIAIAWLAVRPLLGGTLIVAAVAVLVGTFKLGAKRKQLKAS